MKGTIMLKKAGKWKSYISFFCLSILLMYSFSQAQEKNKEILDIDMFAEFGFFAVLDHKVQFGRDGTYLDYNENGGQDVLFPFTRFGINTQLNRNIFVLLYQPLLLKTTELIDRDLVIDDLVFPEGTPVEFTYGFPFYRFSYAFDITEPGGEWDIGLGLSLQIRNATITFQSTDGELYRTNRDVGLVPLLKALFNWRFTDNFHFGAEIDGIYAPVSYLNGDNNDVTGALIDASIRAGYVEKNKRYKIYLNLRYLAGGAQGQSDNYEPPSDGYVKNWLNFLTVSTLFSWNIF